MLGSLLLVLACLLSAGAQVDDMPGRADQPYGFVPSCKAPVGGVVLAVEAGEPPKAQPEAPASPSTPQGVAARFGWQVIQYGAVTVVAPKTRVALYLPPTKPNLLQGLGASTAFNLLLTRLDQGQLAKLKSAKGLGLDDLTDDLDKDLLKFSIAGGGKLYAQKSAGPYTQTPELTSVLDQVRVRLAKHAWLYVTTTGGGGANNSIPGKYYVAASGHAAITPTTVVVENKLRPGDLSFSSAKLQCDVSVAACHKVMDLIEAVRTASGVEVYADPRLGAKLVGLSGATNPVKASELLKACSVALGATYRRVGPAYVLTDDLLGVGQRRWAWDQYERACKAEYDRSLEASHDSLMKELSLDKLGVFEHNVTPSPEQAARALKTDTRGPGVTHVLRYDQLSAEQKTVAVQTRKWAHNSSDGDKPFAPSDEITLETIAQPEALIPGLDAPAVMSWVSNVSFYLLPKYVLPTPKPIADDGPTAWRKVLQRHPLRAATVDLAMVTRKPACLAGFAKLGMTDLWLRVPCETLVAWATSGKGADSDLKPSDLHKALAEAKKRGLKPYVLLDPMTAASSEGQPLDLDIAGRPLGDSVYDTGVLVKAWWLDPENPTLRSELSAIGRWLASQRELEGVALRRTAAYGYALPQEDLVWGREGTALGFTQGQRLAFLRANSCDPIDLVPALPWGQPDKDVLPNFDLPAPNSEARLVKDWRKQLAASNVAAMHAFADSYRSSGGAGKLYVMSRSVYGSWYGDWEDGDGALLGDGILDKAMDRNKVSYLDEAKRYSKELVGIVVFSADMDLKAMASRLEEPYGAKRFDELTFNFTRIKDLDEFLQRVTAPLKGK